MKIPKISLETMGSTTASLTNNKDFWEAAIDKIKAENPLLYQLLIVNETSVYKDEIFIDGYTRGAILTYILLSNQIEADEMNEVWG
tara:strand:+ start:113 stop:370 length:258 start_codon:yes stop_codon:yes gene_type:complete